jgi:hypothetical protein
VTPEDDQPLTLVDACAEIFDDRITPATLKAEHRRGNLELFKIGRAYFTTRRHIEAMIEKCRLQARPLGLNTHKVDNSTESARAAHAAALALSLSLRKGRAQRK